MYAVMTLVRRQTVCNNNQSTSKSKWHQHLLLFSISFIDVMQHRPASAFCVLNLNVKRQIVYGECVLSHQNTEIHNF